LSTSRMRKRDLIDKLQTETVGLRRPLTRGKHAL
jgi:hypothetical protein